MRSALEIRKLFGACVVAVCAGTLPPQAAAGSVLLDRVVAVVDRHAILQSEVDEEIHLSVLEPASENGEDSPNSALERLISRTLIQEQIRQEGGRGFEPSQAQVEARIVDLRRALPACTRMDCASNGGWAAFLTANHLSQSEVENYIRMRAEMLGFIENRFRAGIRISPEEIEEYYRVTLVPAYPKTSAIPSLASVSSRIEEILLQRQVNSLFKAWLDNLRKQGNVEILDPSLESASAEGGQSR